MDIIEDGVRIRLAVQPGAKRTEIIGEYDGYLKVKIQALPVDGAANGAIVSWLSKLLNVKKSQVVLDRGHRSRGKIISIHGVTAESVESAIKLPPS